MNNLNIQENLVNNENFRSIPNIPKKGFSANNLMGKSNPTDAFNNINNLNNNLIYSQQHENNNNMHKFFTNNNNFNIDSFVFEGNKNNPINKISGYSQGNQINNINKTNNTNSDDTNNSFNTYTNENQNQNQFENNSKIKAKGGVTMPKKLIGAGAGRNMLENSFNESSININFNSGNNNKNGIQKKNSLNLNKNSGTNNNNLGNKNSANNLINNREGDIINSSFTSVSSQKNSLYEILDDENFDNFIERVGENLKYLIKNQKGSRSMQKFLDKIYPEHVNLLLAKISVDLKEIMMDPYGNYFIQNLIQCSSSNQRMTILNTVIIIYFCF